MHFCMSEFYGYIQSTIFNDILYTFVWILVVFFSRINSYLVCCLCFHFCKKLKNYVSIHRSCISDPNRFKNTFSTLCWRPQNDLLLYILGLGILILISHYDNKTIPTMYDFQNSTNIYGQKQVSRIVKIVHSGPHF